MTPRLIYPAQSGGDLRVYSLLRCLADRYRVTLLSFHERGRGARAAAAALALERELVHRVHLVERGAPGREAWLPPEAQSWQSEEMNASLDAVVEDERIELAHIEFGELAHYARRLKGRVPVVLTEHDASSLSWGRSYLSPDEQGGAWGRPWSWARQWLYTWRTLRDCDRVVVVSEADRRRLSAVAGGGRVAVVPTGVDTRRFFPGGAARRPGSLVFVGHYPHYPNEEAAVSLARDVLPRVRREIPGARLQLVGSGPTPVVLALESEAIEVTGPVPEVQPYLAAAEVFVAPLRLGFGIKGKLLEAFASGTPVVATPQACEGIPQAKAEEHLLVGDGVEALSAQTVRLLRDPALRRRLAARARELVEKSFTWEAQADRLDRVYRSLLGAREAAHAAR